MPRNNDWWLICFNFFFPPSSCWIPLCVARVGHQVWGYGRWTWGLRVYAFGVTNCEFGTSLSNRYSRRYLSRSVQKLHKLRRHSWLNFKTFKSETGYTLPVYWCKFGCKNVFMLLGSVIPLEFKHEVMVDGKWGYVFGLTHSVTHDKIDTAGGICSELCGVAQAEDILGLI
jgi:hypothetical protein